ncbi:MAG: cytochrome C, partial [Rubrivivax sp.]
MRARLAGAALSALVAAAAAAPAQDTLLGRMVPARADAPAVASTHGARATYLLHCSGCHRPDGSGAPERYVPDLRALGRFLQVDGGRAFIVQVPGVMGS